MSRRGGEQAAISSSERLRILTYAAKQVGPALFATDNCGLFLPVFLLEAQEGRMFRPLVWTKTLAVGFSSLLAITFVPAIMLLLIRGRLRPRVRESDLTCYSSGLLTRSAVVLAELEACSGVESGLPRAGSPARLQARQPVHACLVRGLITVHAKSTSRHINNAGVRTATGTGSHHPQLP